MGDVVSLADQRARGERVTVRMSREEATALRAYAERHGVDLSGALRMALARQLLSDAADRAEDRLAPTTWELVRSRSLEDIIADVVRPRSA